MSITTAKAVPDRPRTLLSTLFSAKKLASAITPAEQNFWRGLAFGAGLVLLFQVISWLEQDIFHVEPHQRLVGKPSEAAMRYFTLAHYFVALFFMVTSAKNRTMPRRWMLLGLLLGGGGLCWVYNYFGGSTSVLMSFWVYSYFLVHEMRDEVLFHASLSNSPPAPDKAQFQRLANGLIAQLNLGLGAILWLAGVMGWWRQGPVVSHLTSILPADLGRATQTLLALSPVAAWLFASHLLLKRAAQACGGVADFLSAYAPMLRLFGGAFLVLGLGLLLTKHPYALILLHVSVWYVFVSRQLKKKPPQHRTGGYWTWMRTTLQGFRVLHIGLFIGLVAAGMIWMYGFGGQGWLWYLLAPEVFLYWTIMHITVSFVPR